MTRPDDNLGPLCDAHLHLQDAAYGDDPSDIVRRAQQAGVRLMVVNATFPGDFQDVLDLAGRFDPVVPCLGLHPCFIDRAEQGWPDRLASLLGANPQIGIGEIGLDQWVEPRDEAAQEHAFTLQLDLARRFGRPVMIHCLRAWGWLMDVLRRGEPLPAGMLIHACGASPEVIDELTEMGAYFSVCGDTFEAKRKRKQRAAAHIRPDRLLIETDAPYMLPPESLSPVTIDGPEDSPRNTPANCPKILTALAKLRDQDPAQLAEQCWLNAQRFLAPLVRVGP